MSKERLVLLSPIFMVIICHLVARISSSMIGKWAFIPVMLTMWAVCWIMISLSGKSAIQNKWLGKSKGKWGWKVLVLLIGLLPLPVFLLHWDLLKAWEIFIPYILIAVINPFMEEFYWRGVLLDRLTHLPHWQGVLYAAFFFALYHPLSFGVFSELNAGYTVFVSTFVMGLIWGIAYKKIGSLRWMIFSHFLVDSFNLSVPAFLDLFEQNWG